MFATAFTVAQSAVGTVTITDTSDYSSETKDQFNDRFVRLTRSDGTPLGSGDFTMLYTDGDSLTIPLDRDYALLIEMQTIPVDPVNGSTYTKSKYELFEAYSQAFRYEMIQGEAANPAIINKANYIANKQQIFTDLYSAEIAITYQDISGAQSALDRIQLFINNKSLYL